MTYKKCIELIEPHAKDFIVTIKQEELSKFINKGRKYLYFILWSSDSNIYSWGTMSGSSNRIRKSSILNSKLTGKYDRRVDYLMLKKIYDLENIYVFETLEDPTIVEGMLKALHGEKFCYNGIKGRNRDEISRSIYEMFKSTGGYSKLANEDKTNFDYYFNSVYLAKMRHPDNPKRTFYYGDSLEPKFLRTIGKEFLEPSIERVLDVKFYT